MTVEDERKKKKSVRRKEGGQEPYMHRSGALLLLRMTSLSNYRIETGTLHWLTDIPGQSPIH